MLLFTVAPNDRRKYFTIMENEVQENWKIRFTRIGKLGTTENFFIIFFSFLEY